MWFWALRRRCQSWRALMEFYLAVPGAPMGPSCWGLKGHDGEWIGCVGFRGGFYSYTSQSPLYGRTGARPGVPELMAEKELPWSSPSFRWPGAAQQAAGQRRWLLVWIEYILLLDSRGRGEVVVIAPSPPGSDLSGMGWDPMGMVLPAPAGAGFPAAHACLAPTSGPGTGCYVGTAWRWGSRDG